MTRLQPEQSEMLAPWCHVQQPACSDPASFAHCIIRPPLHTATSSLPCTLQHPVSYTLLKCTRAHLLCATSNSGLALILPPLHISGLTPSSSSSSSFALPPHHLPSPLITCLHSSSHSTSSPAHLPPSLLQSSWTFSMISSWAACWTCWSKIRASTRARAPAPCLQPPSAWWWTSCASWCCSTPSDASTGRCATNWCPRCEYGPCANRWCWRWWVGGAAYKYCSHTATV
eukprot:scaffold225256_cov16-Tisochrysis_lutea.AAC.1